MEQVIKPLLLFFMCITISYAKDFLQNPDFESPPPTTNSTSDLLLVTTANPIPGWSFNGTVWYVTSSGANSSSFPLSGHAVRLGEHGSINQTLRVTGDVLDYVLSFTLAAQREDCVNNRTAVNVSVSGEYEERSKVFSLERNLSRNLWESYGFYLGRMGGGDFVNLQITNINVPQDNNNNNNNITCWPMVDTFVVKRNWLPRWYDGNTLANGDFEVGPPFMNNSSEGILLDEEPERFDSPLQEWSILGTIRYIDSKHYKVPHGRAAIQLLNGDPSGIQIGLTLQMTLTYTLNFTMGDANDSCVGDFVVYVQLGQNVHNFTMRSNGTGSAFKHSIAFKPEDSLRETSISLYSFNESRKSDGVLCGPVLDNILLYGSDGGRIGSGGGKIEIYVVFIFSMFILMLW